MGFNTTVVVHNDSVHTIEKDPDFGKNLAKAIKHLNFVEKGQMVGVPSMGHCNAAEVIECHHADHNVLVMIGGNRGQEFGYAGGHRMDATKPEDRIAILKNLADREGYNLHKKPKKT